MWACRLVSFFLFFPLQLYSILLLECTIFYVTSPLGFPGGTSGKKNLSANARDIRDVGLIPGWGRPSRGGGGDSLQYSCLEKPLDRGAWRVMVHRVARNRTWLKRLSTHVALLIDNIERKGRRKKRRKERKKPRDHPHFTEGKTLSQVTLNWRLKFRFSSSHLCSSGYSVQPGRTASEVPASQVRFLTARLVDFCVPPRGTCKSSGIAPHTLGQ